MFPINFSKIYSFVKTNCNIKKQIDITLEKNSIIFPILCLSVSGICIYISINEFINKNMVKFVFGKYLIK